ELAVFAQLYDEAGTEPIAARLPAIHSKQLLDVLDKFANQSKRLGDFQGDYYTTQHWNETNAVDDGIIRRMTSFPADASQWILPGAHLSVGKPSDKTPRTLCTERGHYDGSHLLTIPHDHLPRTNSLPARSHDEYRGRTPGGRSV